MFIDKNKCDVALTCKVDRKVDFWHMLMALSHPQINDHEQELRIDLHNGGPWAQ